MLKTSPSHINLPYLLFASLAMMLGLSLILLSQWVEQPDTMSNTTTELLPEFRQSDPGPPDLRATAINRSAGVKRDTVWQARQLGASLETIEQMKGLEEKLRRFRDHLASIYGENIAYLLHSKIQTLADRFVRLPSVQAELKKLPADSRHASLARIRRTLGMDHSEVEHWHKLDLLRDQQRYQGEQYHAMRDSLIAGHQGPSLNLQLRALREHYFGTQAALIAAEEQQGFFRFAEPQLFGSTE